MKAKKKPCSKRVASDDWLGNGQFWILYDASGKYTGHTLWETQRMAVDELTFQRGNLPRDSKFRIRKVKVRIVT